MKIYRISQWKQPQQNEEYSYIGHHPSNSNPVYLWIMKSNGDILTSKIISDKDYHGNKFINDLYNAIAQGRYDTLSKICSISYGPDCRIYNISSSWVKSLLKETFPGARLIEFNKSYCTGFSITNLKTSQTQKIVSFDFDSTIFIPDWDKDDGYYKSVDGSGEATGVINVNIADLIRKYHSQGWKCICVTSRFEKDKQFVIDTIKKHNLPIQEVYCTNQQDKVFKLKELGVSIHYDDDTSEIMMAERGGIEAIQVNA